MKIVLQKTIVPAVLLACSLEAAASGIPVVDAAALELAQQHQLQNFAQMLKDYEQMVMQYQQMVSTYKNFTGTRGLEMLGYNMELRKILPSNFSSQLQRVLKSGKASISADAREIFNDLDMGKSCEGQSTEKKELCEKHMAVKAEFASMLKKGQQTLDQKLSDIEATMAAIRGADDAKAIADLNASLNAQKLAFTNASAQMQSQFKNQEILNEQLDMQLRKEEAKSFRAMSKEEIRRKLTRKE